MELCEIAIRKKSLCISLCPVRGSSCIMLAQWAFSRFKECNTLVRNAAGEADMRRG